MTNEELYKYYMDKQDFDNAENIMRQMMEERRPLLTKEDWEEMYAEEDWENDQKRDWKHWLELAGDTIHWVYAAVPKL